MKRTFLYTLLAGLALAPVAAQAQPSAYSSRDGLYDQSGYYDHTGRWHAGEANPYPDGTFDQNGQFHRYADEGQGNYDRSGNTPGGYYDQNGNWVPNAMQQHPGYVDADGRWHGYGDYDHDNRGDRNDRGYGPERWTYNERGRYETLDLAARNLALTADAVTREAYRHSTYRDRDALEALQRLDRAASYLARASYRGNRPESVGRAYLATVNAFVEAQRTFGDLQPDGFLSNQFHVLASAMSRLDRRYFGSRAFNGQGPDWGGYRPY